MKFLFDMKDSQCLPMAWGLIAEIKPFIDKIKTVEFEEGTEKKSRKEIFMKMAENVMVKYPEDTSKILSKFWVLEEKDFPVLTDDGTPALKADGTPLTERRMEDAPNVFTTLAAFISSQPAIDFFASALPSLLQISKDILPRLK